MESRQATDIIRALERSLSVERSAPIYKIYVDMYKRRYAVVVEDCNRIIAVTEGPHSNHPYHRYDLKKARDIAYLYKVKAHYHLEQYQLAFDTFQKHGIVRSDPDQLHLFAQICCGLERYELASAYFNDSMQASEDAFNPLTRWFTGEPSGFPETRVWKAFALECEQAAPLLRTEKYEEALALYASVTLPNSKEMQAWLQKKQVTIFFGQRSFKKIRRT